MELEISTVGTEHSRILARHRCEMFREMGSLSSAHDEELFERSVRYFERAIPAGRYVAFLATSPSDPATVVGGGGVQIRELLPRPLPAHAGLIEGEQALVLNMYVEPEHRRLGIASAILDHILTWCGKRAIRSVVLHASDAGRPLYEKRGFRGTNEMSLYLSEDKLATDVSH